MAGCLTTQEDSCSSRSVIWCSGEFWGLRPLRVRSNDFKDPKDTVAARASTGPVTADDALTPIDR